MPNKHVATSHLLRQLILILTLKAKMTLIRQGMKCNLYTDPRYNSAPHMSYKVVKKKKKMEIHHRLTLNSFYGEKYPAYTNYYHMRPTFWPI